MKHILPIALVLCLASLSSATTINQGRILNQNLSYGDPSYADDVNVTASTPTDYTGAVEASGTNITTNLYGNVSITQNGDGSGVVAYGNGNNVVNINSGNLHDVHVSTYKNGGANHGLYTYAANVINVNAGTSKNIYITMGDGTNGAGSGYGVRAHGGAVNLTAREVHVDYASLGGSVGVGAYGGKINVTGDLFSSCYTSGVNARAGGSVKVSGNVSTKTSYSSAHAVYAAGAAAGGGDTVYIGGRLTSAGAAAYGIYADTGAVVTLAKGASIAATASTSYAIFANGVGTIVQDKIANGANGTLYNLSGLIHAQSNATVDLHMGAGSTYNGYTLSSGKINLELSNGATWTTVTTNSTMGTGKLSLLDGGNISFAKLGENNTSGNFCNINAASVMLSSTSILNIDIGNSALAAIAGGGTYSATLFTGLASGWQNDGALLLSSDGTKQFSYTNPSKGVFLINGVSNYTAPAVPEPTTASLAMLGLASMILRRRRV